MVKVLATADWQLGKAISGAGEQSQIFREQLFLTAERIVTEIAPKNDADLIVVCGDLFDSEKASWELIERTAEMFKKSEIPIHIISGNHDALDSTEATCLWKLYRELGSQSNVIIHITREPYHIENLGCTIYPGVLNSRFDNYDKLCWIPERNKSDGVRIGLFHGAICNFGDGDDARIKNLDPTLAIDKDLDIALLGDWHQPKGDEKDSLMAQPDNRLWYTWAPEAQKLSDNKIGRVLLCDLEVGKEPNVNPIEVGKNCFMSKPIEFDESYENEHFESEIEAISELIEQSSDYNLVIRIIASGWLNEADYNRLESTIDEMRSNGNKIMFRDNLSILPANLDKSEDLINQISETINGSAEPKEIKDLAIKLLYKYARQELGGD
ncbi:MAG: metallophosphoesterase [Candidatus Thermoplasmatota archaeon]|nr:metallophosphoesterase [Candidatus Thermoplasmatota archaeon]